MRKSFLAIGIALWACLPAQAGTVLDLTTNNLVVGNATIGKGFLVGDDTTQAAGSGTYNPFLRINSNDSIERGFNTSTKAAQMPDAKDPFTSDLLLGDIPIITLLGLNFRQFSLDINQVGNGPISLNQVQIFSSAAAIVAGTSSLTSIASATTNDVLALSGASLKFQMSDALVSSSKSYTVTQDSSSGSGSGDLFFLVQDTLFAGLGAGTHITLFASLGAPPGTFGETDGFEEWAVRGEGGGGGPGGSPDPQDINDVPEPTTAAIAGVLLVGMGLQRWRRRIRLDTPK